MALFFDMIVLTSLIPIIQCPIMVYIYHRASIQSVLGGNVFILGGHIIGYSKQRTVYINVSNYE